MSVEQAGAAGELVAYEAGVASFPRDLSAQLRALLLAPHPDFPYTWDAFACAAAAEKAVELHHEDLAEAWAWRCADTMPDSAQSRRDSLADAETLRDFQWGRESAVPRSPQIAALHRAVACGNIAGEWMRDAGEAVVRRRGAVFLHERVSAMAYSYGRQAAHAAFRAVPGLRSR